MHICFSPIIKNVHKKVYQLQNKFCDLSFQKSNSNLPHSVLCNDYYLSVPFRYASVTFQYIYSCSAPKICDLSFQKRNSDLPHGVLCHDHYLSPFFGDEAVLSSHTEASLWNKKKVTIRRVKCCTFGVKTINWNVLLRVLQALLRPVCGKLK